jgi:hypothetical protein
MTKPSNFKLDATSELDQLEQALILGFGEDKALAFRVLEGEGVSKLLLYAYYFKEDPTKHIFLVPMGPKELLPTVEAWLNKTKYGPSPDIDGSSHKGFRVSTASPSGRYDPDLLLVIEPEWAFYSK